MDKAIKTLRITAENQGQRLDKFLADFDAERSRVAWQKIIRSGKVLVNGKVTGADYTVKEGDTLEILAEEPQTEREVKIPDIPILYEDEDVIVINKPIGVLAQKASTSSAPAVTDFLEKHFPPIAKVGEEEQRSGIVHRLDKDTSGIMLAAKTQAAFDFLKEKFQKREVEKTYTALVYGQVEPAAGEINLAIGRHPKAPCRQTVVPHPEDSPLKCRPARTLYRTLRSSGRFSLLAVELKTGRMHQIRVHLQAVGHPVVGDPKYAPPRLLRSTPQLRRQFLHASELRIELPRGQNRTFRSELPADLRAFLQNLPDLD
jgi:23S rRNA pseudouridine1911/1915/1917 synthase